MIEQPPQDWAATRAQRLGYDPWLLSEEAVARYAAAGLEMVPLSPNPDRRPVGGPAAAARQRRPLPQPLAFAGQSAAEKIGALAGRCARPARMRAC